MSAGGGQPEETGARLRAIADRIWESFNARDWEAFYALGTPDYAIRTDPRWPGGGEYRGREEIEPFMEQFLEAWEGLRYERASVPGLVNGRHVERGAWVGTGLSTGIPARIEFTIVVTVTGDDLISRADFFLEHDDAVAFARGEAERG